MKIRMKVPFGGSLGGQNTVRRGQVVDTQKAEAERLIKAGYAELVEDEPAEDAQPEDDQPEPETASMEQPETATSGPQRRRRNRRTT